MGGEEREGRGWGEKRGREEGGERREGRVAKHECSMSDVTSHRQTLLVRLVSLIIVQEPP